MVYNDLYGDIDSFSGATDSIGQYGTYLGDGIHAIIVIVYLVIIGACLIGMIVDYLLRGLGMYKLGKAEGKENCWLAFVPFARVYFQGELGGPIRFKNRTMKNPGIWMVVVPIAVGVVSGIGYFIFFMVTMVNAVLSSGYQAIENIAVGMLSGIVIFFVITLIVAMIYQAFIHVLYVLVNYQIYSRYTSNNMAILHAVLGTLIPLYQSIYMFILGRQAEAASLEINVE